jgi:hypothetical protein
MPGPDTVAPTESLSVLLSEIVLLSLLTYGSLVFRVVFGKGGGA